VLPAIAIARLVITLMVVHKDHKLGGTRCRCVNNPDSNMTCDNRRERERERDRETETETALCDVYF
jgi:hypothetical protein